MAASGGLEVSVHSLDSCVLINEAAINNGPGASSLLLGGKPGCIPAVLRPLRECCSADAQQLTSPHITSPTFRCQVHKDNFICPHPQKAMCLGASLENRSNNVANVNEYLPWCHRAQKDAICSAKSAACLSNTGGLRSWLVDALR